MQVLKLSKIYFVEDSVFLDRPSPRHRDACQFCFTVALEVALFGGEGVFCRKEESKLSFFVFFPRPIRL